MCEARRAVHRSTLRFQRSVHSVLCWLIVAQSTATSFEICSGPYGTRAATSGVSCTVLLTGPSIVGRDKRARNACRARATVGLDYIAVNVQRARAQFVQIEDGAQRA